MIKISKTLRVCFAKLIFIELLKYKLDKNNYS